MSTNEADLREGSADEILEDVEETEEQMEEEGNGSSSSSDESNAAPSNGVNADQDLNRSVSSILQRDEVPFDGDASVTPRAQSPAPARLFPNSTLASPQPLHLPNLSTGELVFPQAGMYQTQQDHEMGMNLINPNQGTFSFSHVGGVFPGNQRMFNHVPQLLGDHQRMTNHGLQFPGDHQRMINHGSPFPGDYHHQAMRIGGATNNNNYQLPTSNLPSDFRWDSPPTRTGPPMNNIHVPIPQYQQARAGNGNIGSPMMRPQWANRHHQQNQLVFTDHSTTIYGQQEYTVQGGLLDPAFVSSNYHHQGGSSSHQMQFVNMPFQMRMGALMGSSLPYEPDSIASNYNNNRMRMNWTDNIPAASNIHQVNWIPQGQNFVIPAPAAPPPNPTTFPKNSLYDPLYETMGLPVDPHLRMFLASKRNNPSKYPNHTLIFVISFYIELILFKLNKFQWF
ncbi:hypothetical protein ACOSQ3_014001 [Xanthoceras sorbifolium]